MKEHRVSVGVYQSRYEFDWPLFIKRALVFTIAVLITRVSIRLMVMNLGPLILILTDSQEIADIFMQIKTAHISPPWLIPIIFSLIVSFFTVNKKKQSKKNGLKSVLFYVAFGITVLILFVMTLLFSVYLTIVNQVRVSHIIKVLYPIIKSGALDGVL